MKYLPIFALLLMFACCEENPSQTQCFRVNFSDALPIQFWLNDCETYNESVPQGVHYKCFCHPWNCDDELNIQFTDDDDFSYELAILDEDDNELERLPFETTPFSITTGLEQPINNTFINSLSPWTNVDRGAPFTTVAVFTWSSNKAVVTVPQKTSNGEITSTLRQNYSLLANRTYRFRITGTSQANSTDIVLACLNSVTSYRLSDSESLPTGTWTIDFLLTPTQDTDLLYFYIAADTGGIVLHEVDSIELIEITYGGVYTLSFTPGNLSPEICDKKIKLQVINIGSPEEVVAKSDCIFISDNHPDPTILYEYSNNRNFAGLIYEDLSPAQTFQIRVPAVFFHEQFPEEDEAIELSDSKIINLNGVVRAQRLFDSAHMPYYMHRKMKLIFKHQTLLTPIDDKYWTKQDAYEIQEGDRRWPLKKAKCWLTERDFVQRNVV